MTTASIDALAYIDAPADASAASLIPAPTSALPAPPIYERNDNWERPELTGVEKITAKNVLQGANFKF
jgi:hypothetical protein